MITLNSG